MVKKVSTILLSLMLFVSFMPTIAFADEEVPPGPPTPETAGFSIGEDYYTSLQDAMLRAKSDDVIKVNLPEVDCTSTGGIIIDREITLDLNGHKILLTNAMDGNIQITSTGSLTLKDSAIDTTPGSIVSSTPYTSAKYNTGIICCSGEFIMDGGIISAKCTDPADNGQFGVMVMDNGKVTINNGKIEAGWYAITGNGKNIGKTEVTINGGNLISEADYAIYNPQVGLVHLNGGTVTGASGAIAMNAGNLIVTRGSAITTGSSSTGDWTDGTSGLTNAAININSKYNDVDCLIEGGFVFASGDAVEIIQGKDHKASITITGGEFSSNVSKWVKQGYDTLYNEEHKTWDVKYHYVPSKSTPTGPITTTSTDPTTGTKKTVITDKDVLTGISINTQIEQTTSGTTNVTNDVNVPIITQDVNNVNQINMTDTQNEKILETIIASEKTITSTGAPAPQTRINLIPTKSIKDTGSATLTVNAPFINDLVNKTNSVIDLELGIGTVSLEKDFLKEILPENNDGEIKLSIQKVEPSSLPTDVQNKFNKDSIFLNFSLETKDGKVSSFNGSTVKMKLDVTGIKDPKFVYIDTNGKLTNMNMTLDETGDFAILKLPHFSYYAVVSADELQPILDKQNQEKLQLLAKNVQNTKVYSSSTVGKRYVKVTWKKSFGYKVDGYKVYRATSKNGKYKLVKTTSLKSFKNTKLTKGKKYFFKVRGYRTIDGKTVYTKYSNITYKKVK